MSHTSTCSQQSGYWERDEATYRPITKDGQNCTQYGVIHKQICLECNQEIGDRKTWGQIRCP